MVPLNGWFWDRARKVKKAVNETMFATGLDAKALVA